MPIRPIVRYPDPKLAQRCEAVGNNISQLGDLFTDMVDTMYASDGAGLAAIQIGVPLRLFIVDPVVAGLDPSAPPMAFVDPEIIELSAEVETTDEGCLSFPGIFVPVERSFRCRTRARNLDGNLFEVEGEGLFARAMQHENDHLDGRLLSDYVGRMKRKMIARRLAREAAAEASA
jgi:peptide deformylase